MNVPLQYYAVVKKPSRVEVARNRVRVEKRELDVKYQALSEFLDDPNNFNTVGSVESGLMYDQRNAMKHYREALRARLIHWEEE